MSQSGYQFILATDETRIEHEQPKAAELARNKAEGGSLFGNPKNKKRKHYSAIICIFFSFFIRVFKNYLGLYPRKLGGIRLLVLIRGYFFIGCCCCDFASH